MRIKKQVHCPNEREATARWWRMERWYKTRRFIDHYFYLYHPGVSFGSNAEKTPICSIKFVGKG